jgi:hypothetical protein
MSDFDPSLQWHWAAWSGDPGQSVATGNRFIVAKGQQELSRRILSEVCPNERCHHARFGPADGNASLADCMYVFLSAREQYGANYNRVIVELARVPAWALFIKQAPSVLANWISNPTSHDPLSRERYDSEMERKLGHRIADTLSLNKDWWVWS